MNTIKTSRAKEYINFIVKTVEKISLVSNYTMYN